MSEADKAMDKLFSALMDKAIKTLADMTRNTDEFVTYTAKEVLLWRKRGRQRYKELCKTFTREYASYVAQEYIDTARWHEQRIRDVADRIIEANRQTVVDG